jgi:hypothetical protein
MWVKLHDSWLEWEWHTDPNMVSLFFHLLSMASKKDTRFRGYDIKRGQVVVGRKMLSEKTGISEQTVRTCLARLEHTGEISRKSTNKFSIITICNYNSYQPNFGESNQQLTSNQPTTNQQLTTLKDNKNIDNNSTVLGVRARLEDATINNSLWLDKATMELRCPNVMQLAVDVMNEWELTHQPESEWTVMHLYNHIRKKLDISKREGKPSRQEAKEARRADLKQKALQDLIAATNGIYQQPTDRNGYNSRQ